MEFAIDKDVQKSKVSESVLSVQGDFVLWLLGVCLTVVVFSTGGLCLQRPSVGGRLHLLCPQCPNTAAQHSGQRFVLYHTHTHQETFFYLLLFLFYFFFKQLCNYSLEGNSSYVLRLGSLLEVVLCCNFQMFTNTNLERNVREPFVMSQSVFRTVQFSKHCLQNDLVNV